MTTLGWLQLIERELLLFALFWFLIGMIDELAIDVAWLWLRATGRIPTRHVPIPEQAPPLRGPWAVFVPAWHEAEVIGATVAHMLRAWPQQECRLYVGCYRNDRATIAAVIAGAGAAGGDARLRLVIHDRDGPTTKADCLNRLFAAMVADEGRAHQRFRGVVMHDAEDMVHPLGLPVIDRGLDTADFVQLPVRPEPHPAGRWIAGHYCDEFAESHAKAMVVRDCLNAGLPGAGVGCGLSRTMLDYLALVRMDEGATGPFAAECLTEDYELGLLVARGGGRSRFLRLRDAEGALIATRSLFPTGLTAAVRQKTRWIHGIALQEWDRLGWSERPVEIWMSLRDRRGPLTALVLAAAYALLVVEGVLQAGRLAGLPGWDAPGPARSPLLVTLGLVSLAGLLWRALVRAAFAWREYGWREGLCSVLRIPIANLVAIMAGRRALLAYLRSLASGVVVWDKTAHHLHPASLAPPPSPAPQQAPA
ncbi:MAG: glycosyl transferase family protein [Proteobacteria bacterium]|nr:glycosyl transferase family protein [Pseudomonadota bacterium]